MSTQHVDYDNNKKESALFPSVVWETGLISLPSATNCKDNATSNGNT